ncbi:MAG: hypothetical protein JHC95_18030 [Solirubrobacteraceae bacterium]|nr:hypothetical protein [Solirubrobacteraceae bacterium]
MSNIAPDSRAELLRIANLMGVGPEDIEFLGELSAESLFEFRQQLIAIYFEENPSLRRLAKIANMLPSSVIAKITQEAIGPILAARVVGEVDTRAAVGILKRVPIDFICDTAVQADPRRVIPLFSESPTQIAKDVADELIRRKEYVAIGQLIAFVEDDVMEHALNNASDIDILNSSFLVEDKERLGDGVAMLTDERVRSLIKTAAKQQMWLEALDLMSHLDLDEFRRVSTQAMALDDATLDALLAFVNEHGLWYVALPAICLADNPSKGAAALLRAKPAVKKGCASAASSTDYADDVSELLEKVDDPALSKLLSPALAA